MVVMLIYAAVVASVLLVAYLIVQDVVRMGVSIEVGQNNEETPKAYLLHMLAAAERSITIFDDGDKVNDSLYDDSTIVAAFGEKLRENPGFKVECYFNNPRRTMFRDNLERCKGVAIQTGEGANREGYEVHYKIIDGGKMGYLSRHEEQSLARSYQYIDCSNVLRWGFPAVSKRHFGPHFRDFEKRFNRALALTAA